MPPSQRHRSPDVLLARLTDQVDDYEKHRDTASLRELTVKIVAIEKTVRDLGRSVGVAAGLSPTSAHDRIKGYFESYPKQPIKGIESAVISGVSQYARRIRELRDEGLDIRSGPAVQSPDTGQHLLPDEYIYVPKEQQEPLKRI